MFSSEFKDNRWAGTGIEAVLVLGFVGLLKLIPTVVEIVKNIGRRITI